MAMTGDDLLLPMRAPQALRDEVAGRVARRRRQRARRRLVRIGLPIAAAGVLFVVGFERVPGVPTDVDTVGPAHAPAPDGTSTVDTGRLSGGAAAERRLSAAVDGSPAPTSPGTAAQRPPRPAASSPASTSPGAAPSPPGPTTSTRQVRLAVARPDGIWELASDGTARRRLVDSGRDPAWSPDGRHLAFTTRWEGLAGGEGVAVLDLHTMQSRLLLMGSDADYVAPTWSPDGTRLAVSKLDRALGTPPDLQSSVVVVDAADGTRRLEFGPGERPSWLADGRILYRCGKRLCVRSTNGATAEVPNSHDVRGGEWSPDGTWIAAWELDSEALVLLRADGGERRRVVDRITGMPAWSPDGARLVYPSASGLRSARLDGGEVRSLTDQPHDTDPHLVGVRP